MVAFRASATGVTRGSTGTFPVAVPNAAQSGDIALLFVVSQNNTVVIEPPSGFSRLGQARGTQNITGDLFAKKLASEPGTDLIIGINDQSIRSAAHMVIYSDTEIPTLFDSWIGSGSPAAPLLTAPEAGLLAEQVSNRSMDAGTWSWTPPSGLTKRTDLGAGVVGQVGVSCATGDRNVSAGSVGGDIWVPSNTSNHTVAWSVFMPDVPAVVPKVWHVASASGWKPSSLYRL